MTILYVLAAVLMLGIMVTVHEAGHFWAARMTGIPVKEFAIGFGPKILSWKGKKHETQYFLRLIPAGGYCMFYGEDDTKGDEAQNDPRAMGNYAVWRRILTVLAGPVMNFLLALLVATAIFISVGEDTNGEYGYTVIQSVTPGSPADQAGLKPQDVILSVNGEDARGLSDDGTAYRISSLIDAYRPGDPPLTLAVQRGDEQLTLYAAPLYDEAEGRYLVGVSLLVQYTPGYTCVSVPRAAALGASYCVRAGGSILSALRELVMTGRGLEESSGPVGIIQMIAEETQSAAQQSQGAAWLTYAQLLVLISVNLGLFNLIPIPGLDGSRIVFLAIEGIRRKPVPQKVEAYIHMGGYALLFGLMIFMTFKDVLKIFR